MSDTPRLPVLVTGGAGYIGSHTAVALYEADFSLFCWTTSTTPPFRLWKA